jgi:hypothetical protein
VNKFAQEVKRILLPIDPEGGNRLDFATEIFSGATGIDLFARACFAATSSARAAHLPQESKYRKQPHAQ